LLVALGVLLVVAPWTARNAAHFGRFIPITEGGMAWNLWIGTWERSPEWMNGGVIHFPDSAFADDTERQTVLDHRANPTQASNAAVMQLARKKWREAPLSTLLGCLQRERFTWLGTRSELFRYRFEALTTPTLTWRVVKSTQWGLNAIAVLGGLAFLLGRWRSARLRAIRFWLAMPVAFTALAYLPFHSTESRYSQPVLQALIAGAAIIAGLGSEAWFKRRARGLSTNTDRASAP
jgi:hypothetical protein